MYKIKTLQNKSNWDSTPPTIIIENDGSQEWELAYSNWLQGKNPTNDTEWKLGIFATFGECQNYDYQTLPVQNHVQP